METPFTRLVGCRVPIQQAGMGATASVELASAVAAAGGLGMLGTAAMPSRGVELALDAMAHRATGVFGVNFLEPFVDRDLVTRAARIAKVVEFFYGDPNSELVALAHDGGALVSWQVGSVAEAVTATECGCDFIVAQGVEAGGHVRGRLGLLPLLAAVLDAVEIPVLAAGGVGSVRAVTAVMAAGAAGVRVGTRFLGAREADVHPVYRNAVFEASAEDTEITSTFSTWWDAPHRVLRSCIERATATDSEVIGGTPWNDGQLPIPRLCVMHPVTATTGEIDAMALYAGESVGEVRTLMSAAEIIAELMGDAPETDARRGKH